MCLWLLTRVKKGCCLDCCVETSLAGIVLAPLGGLLGFLAGIAMTLVKVVPGSLWRMGTCCTTYWTVIRAGQAAYDTEAPPVPPAGSTTTRAADDEPVTLEALGFAFVETSVRSTGAVCAAEVYCCCFPAFLIFWALTPVFLLLDLLLCTVIVRGLFGGFAAGCGNCAAFGHRFRTAIERIDAASSNSAFASATKFRLCPRSRNANDAGTAAAGINNNAPPPGRAEERYGWFQGSLETTNRNNINHHINHHYARGASGGPSPRPPTYAAHQQGTASADQYPIPVAQPVYP